MKYIMIHKQLDEDQAITYPIIFPNELNHCDVADQMLIHLQSIFPMDACKVISAGFINIDTYKTIGHSETMNLQAREIDGMQIRLRDYYMFDEATEPIKRIEE